MWAGQDEMKEEEEKKKKARLFPERYIYDHRARPQDLMTENSTTTTAAASSFSSLLRLVGPIFYFFPSMHEAQ